MRMEIIKSKADKEPLDIKTQLPLHRVNSYANSAQWQRKRYDYLASDSKTHDDDNV